MTTTTQNRIITAIAGWATFGIIPCEAATTDRGPRAASGGRFAVELSHASGKTAADKITLGEFASQAAADNLAAEVEPFIDRWLDGRRKQSRPAA